MIEFISEAEYERRFEIWSKGRKPNLDIVKTRLAGMISSSANRIAEQFLMNPGKVRQWLAKMKENADWFALRQMFSERFQVGPTGLDRNAIPFSGDWKEK